MKKKLILHIGRHKSGTSSLQLFLCNNAQALREKGFIYPQSLRKPIAHHPLANHYNSNLDAKLNEAEVSAFWREVHAAPNAIISSEAFQNIEPRNLQADLQDFDITLMVYIREQVGYFLSAYAQAIKARKVVFTMDEFEKRHFKADYHVFLSTWAKAFPEARMVVRVFDRGSLLQGDICHDFLVHSGICLPAEVAQFDHSTQDKNPSIGGPLLEFKRLLNATDYDKTVNAMKLYKLLQEMALTFDRYKLTKTVPAHLYDKIARTYQTSNAKLAQDYLATELIIGRGIDRGEQLRLDEASLAQIFRDMASIDAELSSVLESRYAQQIRNSLSGSKRRWFSHFMPSRRA